MQEALLVELKASFLRFRYSWTDIGPRRDYGKLWRTRATVTLLPVGTYWRRLFATSLYSIE